MPVSAAALLVDRIPSTLEETQAGISAVAAGSEDPKAVAERDLRSKAMKEAANSYGARSGLIRGNWETREALKKVEAYYDVIYSFTSLMLIDQRSEETGGDGRARLIRPPVVVEASNAFNQIGPRMIKERDKIYQIISNVAFAPAPPNWRTYLYRDVGESTPALPHHSLMPRSTEEKTRWDGWVNEGWQAGYAQAKAIRNADYNRLERDREGMIRYYELVAQNILSLPVVASKNDGVTGDDERLNVNDVTLMITVIPAFQRQTKNWVTIATDAAIDRGSREKVGPGVTKKREFLEKTVEINEPIAAKKLKIEDEDKNEVSTSTSSILKKKLIEQEDGQYREAFVDRSEEMVGSYWSSLDIEEGSGK